MMETIHGWVLAAREALIAFRNTLPREMQERYTYENDLLALLGAAMYHYADRVLDSDNMPDGHQWDARAVEIYLNREVAEQVRLSLPGLYQHTDHVVLDHPDHPDNPNNPDSKPEGESP